MRSFNTGNYTPKQVAVYGCGIMAIGALLYLLFSYTDEELGRSFGDFVFLRTPLSDLDNSTVTDSEDSLVLGYEVASMSYVDNLFYGDIFLCFAPVLLYVWQCRFRK
jgi:hypothetical protein